VAEGDPPVNIRKRNPQRDVLGKGALRLIGLPHVADLAIGKSLRQILRQHRLDHRLERVQHQCRATEILAEP
jgi:hypothetical protein